MSEYIRKYTRFEYTEVEVIVEGAETEDQADDVAEQHVDLGEGKYRVSGTTDVYVTINETVQDSELEESDEEPEWIGDDEEDEDNDAW